MIACGMLRLLVECNVVNADLAVSMVHGGQRCGVRNADLARTWCHALPVRPRTIRVFMPLFRSARARPLTPLNHLAELSVSLTPA